MITIRLALLAASAASALSVAHHASAQPSSAHPPTPPTPSAAEGAHSHPAGEEVARGAPVARTTGVTNASELARMQSYVGALYDRRDVRHAFELSPGEDVDCVDITKQPALRRPGMATHVIATPPALPASAAIEGNSPPHVAAPAAAPHATGPHLTPGERDAKGRDRSCPAGTIPIRRPRLDDLKSFESIDDYFRKEPHHRASPRPAPPRFVPPAPPSHGPHVETTANGFGLPGSNAPHQYAYAGRGGVPNYGARSIINVWNPSVMHSNEEFSLSQIWVTNGIGRDVQTLEVGVQVYPGKYGDNLGRLFVYSTSDGYDAEFRGEFGSDAGCYNLDCRRFVQTNPRWVLGGPFKRYSVSGGTQAELEVAFFREPTGWWLFLQGEPVGYYPLGLFRSDGLGAHAETIKFGGEILDARDQHAFHTLTAMGSGWYPAAGFRRAAYQRGLRYFDTPRSVRQVTLLTPTRDDALCYDVAARESNDVFWGTYLFFGGPGFTTRCQ